MFKKLILAEVAFPKLLNFLVWVQPFQISVLHCALNGDPDSVSSVITTLIREEIGI